MDPVLCCCLTFASFMWRTAESPHSYKSSPASRLLVGHVDTPTRQDTHLCIDLFSMFRFSVKLGWCLRIFTILVLAGTSTANTFRPLLLQQFLLCSLFTWTVTFWLVCNTHDTHMLVHRCSSPYQHYGQTTTTCRPPCWLRVWRSCGPLGRCRWRRSPAPSVLWLRPWLWWTSGGPDSEAWALRSCWQAGWMAEQLHSGHLSGMDTPGDEFKWDTSHHNYMILNQSM